MTAKRQGFGTLKCKIDPKDTLIKTLDERLKVLNAVLSKTRWARPVHLRVIDILNHDFSFLGLLSVKSGNASFELIDKSHIPFPGKGIFAVPVQMKTAYSCLVAFSYWTANIRIIENNFRQKLSKPTIWRTEEIAPDDRFEFARLCRDFQMFCNNVDKVVFSWQPDWLNRELERAEKPEDGQQSAG